MFVTPQRWVRHISEKMVLIFLFTTLVIGARVGLWLCIVCVWEIISRRHTRFPSFARFVIHERCRVFADGWIVTLRGSEMQNGQCVEQGALSALSAAASVNC